MSVHVISLALKVSGVSPTEKLVLLVLSNYADEHSRAYPSHNRLSKETGLTERTVLNALKSLETKGLIDRRERRRPDGSRSSDMITIRLGGENNSPRGENRDRGVGKEIPGGGERDSGLTTFEPSIEPSIEPREAQAPAPKPDARIGTRLPEDWFPSPLDIDGAAFMTAEARERELEKFRDYWRAVPGAKGRKLDWDATWRNWLRRAEENQPRFRKANDRPDHHTTAGSAREEGLRNMYAGAMAAIDERRRDVG